MRWSGTSPARSSCCPTKDASTPCATSAASPTASPRSRSSRTARSAARSSSPTSARRDVPGDPARDLPASRTHARRLHQQDEDREVEGPGRDPRPGRHREPPRGPPTGTKRPSQGPRPRGRGPDLPARAGVRVADVTTTPFSPTSSRSADARRRSPAVARSGGRSLLAHRGGWRQRAAFRRLPIARACWPRSRR